MAVISTCHNGVGTSSFPNRHEESAPAPPNFSLYESHLNPVHYQNSALFLNSSLLGKEAALSSSMQYRHAPLEAHGIAEKYRCSPSADGVSRAWTNATRPSSPFPDSPSVNIAVNVETSRFPEFPSLPPPTHVPHSKPTVALPLPSPGIFPDENSSECQRHLAIDLTSCGSGPHSLPLIANESTLLWQNSNPSIHSLPIAYPSSSTSSLTYSDLTPSDSSSRSWTPDQAEPSHPLTEYSEIASTSRRFTALGSPANIEPLPTALLPHNRASPPDFRDHGPGGTPRRVLPSHRSVINPSDSSSNCQSSHFREDSQTFSPYCQFSPNTIPSRSHFPENSPESHYPLTPLTLPPPGLELLSARSSFAIPPIGYDSTNLAPFDGAPSQCDYWVDPNTPPFFSPGDISLCADPTSRTPGILTSSCYNRLVSPSSLSSSSNQGRMLAGKHDAIPREAISGPCGKFPLVPIQKMHGPNADVSNKKKKREIREVEAACGVCGKRIARLTLRGSAEELYIENGFDVVYTCQFCHEGRPVENTEVSGNVSILIPFANPSKTQNFRPAAVTSDTPPQGSVTTFRKRNRRTDDVTAPTICDCCARQLGVGGLVPRNSRTAIQFAVEVVCIHCVYNFRRCTDCGGGGGSRLGVGKWRCKELFSDGRRTCILSHQRQGTTTEAVTAIWKVSELADKTELETLVGQIRQLVKHSLYAALATPEMLESGLAKVATFEDVKTMYTNGWKEIEPLIFEDVETALERRRYVGLRWTKPHPRKGPKRVAAPTDCNQVLSSDSDKTLLLQPGKELSAFVLSEWDMKNGTFFVSVAMPWQSGDALGTTAGLANKSFLEATADRQQHINALVSQGMDHREAQLRYPPIRHLWTILFFQPEARLVQFLEKRRKFVPLEEYLAQNPDARQDMFPPVRDCYVPRDQQAGWSVWVRRQNESHTTP